MSKNDLFFSHVDSPSPPRLLPPKRQTPGPDAPRTPSAFAVNRGVRSQHAKTPSFGRMSVDERESEKKRIRSEQNIQIRVFLERAFKLGEGRNAEVYLGAFSRRITSPTTGAVPWKLCAVKRLQLDRESQLAGLEEAFALRRLGPHPHIVRLLGVLDEVEFRTRATADEHQDPDDPPHLLIVLEYLPFSLASFVHHQPSAVTLPQWLAWALELTSTIEWLHQRGCVHGDIKQENVLLTPSLSVKLCDFSSVLFSNASSPATDTYSVGTPAFRAPELFNTTSWSPSEEAGLAHPALSYTLDTFSLGVLLYTLATGVEPNHRVGSVMAMRQRQKIFFSSEEGDRIERIHMGYDSQSQSHSTSPASSITSSPSRESRSPSMRDPDAWLPSHLVDRLLDPSPYPQGVMTAPRERTRVGAPRPIPLMRAASIHTAGMSDAWLKPPADTSLGDGRLRRSRTVQQPGQRAKTLGARPSTPTAPFETSRDLPMQDLLDLLPSLRSTTNSGERDTRPYADGAPALIMPGGDRLPDELRDLIQCMVEPKPEARPTTRHIMQVLERHADRVVDAHPTPIPPRPWS
ncbi:hypothetical protein MNAN1_001391 [Malassezia nana]|uniref:Protein kinase domain-containing protein n=1 Tax=Malassezia nana TaxID=180528 RepID=A0AAF0EKH1_9BASI|nr:hypothetical protein MNAN1_001391 [Malassezia nana]